MDDQHKDAGTALFLSMMDGGGRLFRLQAELTKMYWGMHGHCEGFDDLGHRPAGQSLSGQDDFAAINENARRLLQRHVGAVEDIGPMPGFDEPEPETANPAAR